MAYKNKKKNKARADEVRKQHSSYKHQKKKNRYERKHPLETEKQALTRLAKQLGMI